MEWIMNWWWVTVLGPIILGGAIAYALMTRRRLASSEKAAQHAGVERVYEEEPTDRPAVTGRGAPRT